ncbi:LuxR C-terminal-related transcriptional regulator [Lysinibacillus capsici]
MERVNGDREVQVLNWMLDGKSQRWIGQHMALSVTSIKRIKDNIVNQMME